MNKIYYTNSAQETRDFGQLLGSFVKPRMVFLLDGDLGSGKTTLTQGIAKGLDIERRITSPTFNILKIYQGRLPLYHIDAYRLEDHSQDLGFDELIDDDGLTVIEWSQFVPELKPKQYLIIHLNRLDEDKREIILEPIGETYESFVKELP